MIDLERLATHLRSIGSRGYTTDEDNDWLLDQANQLDELIQLVESKRDADD